MALSRIVLVCLSVAASTSALHAQAAVEYAAKTAGSSLSGMHLGSCSLDRTLIPCAQHSYPAAFYLAIIGIFLAVGFLLYPKSRV
jgi:hypothetical protein